MKRLRDNNKFCSSSCWFSLSISRSFCKLVCELIWFGNLVLIGASHARNEMVSSTCLCDEYNSSEMKLDKHEFAQFV